MDEPLEQKEASRLAKEILENGVIRYTKHALEEMEKDNLSEADILRTLRAGCEPPEWENGQWRYRFRSYSVWAVVLFRNEELIVIITAWRKKS